MTKRIVLAGVLGGVAMFIWSSIAHIALPLGRSGIREIPDDRALLGVLHSTLGESSGLYFYPGFGSSDMKQYDQKLAANPSGLLIYHPPGGKAMTPSQLITEFLTEIIEALLLAWLMAQMRFESFAKRLGLALVIGIIAAMT
ncbi:MAG TPA: hypothetical protein VIX89_07160, partial [Bryobacteraceae bacterium]